ncbi:MAG: prepilin-type N-terminal cleavage/methylation domain-containing protein [Dethiobacter sp.]|jgi:prepilin-type N-terminal cleavage/methylation domain-containing protein|nr:prepilin-type N-terminal cleavage/methylation domain-containing protein [Dethiobacter sp.]
MVLKIADFIRRSKRNERGFTLIELLVVIAILGVLMALAVPRVVGAVDTARENTDRANQQVLKNAVERYYIDNSAYPETLADLVTTYIKEVPARKWGTHTGTDGLTGNLAWGYSGDTATGVFIDIVKDTPVPES